MISTLIKEIYKPEQIYEQNIDKINRPEFCQNFVGRVSNSYAKKYAGKKTKHKLVGFRDAILRAYRG